MLRRYPPLLLIFLPSALAIDTFAARLDCLRINSAFCCTSRIRKACPGLCAEVECGPSFYRGMFSTDEEEPKEGTVVVDSARFRPDIPAGMTPAEAVTSFPTLVPAVVPDETHPPSASPPPDVVSHLGTFGEVPSATTTNPPVMMESVATKVPRLRVTPDPRIIPPPGQELAFITDIDENELEEEGPAVIPKERPNLLLHHRSQVPELPPPTTVAPPPIETITQTPISPVTNLPQFTLPTISWPVFPGFTMDTPPTFSFFQPPTEFPKVPAPSRAQALLTTTTLAPVTTPQPNSTAKKILPADMPSISSAFEPLIEKMLASLPGGMASSVPASASTAKSKRKSVGKTEPGLKYTEGLLGSVETSTSTPTRTVAPEGSFSFKMVRHQPPAINNSISAIEPKIEATPCGQAPDYKPCLTVARASEKLLQCVVAKGLPPGCQKLARYDVTQVEVKGALDRGECGFLHVAPFLECASQGNDNRQCCRAMGVHATGGEHCLAFCNAGPIHPGIQHLSCSSAMPQMLHCHHAGIPAS